MPIESQFTAGLVDHLNAEIVLGTVRALRCAGLHCQQLLHAAARKWWPPSEWKGDRVSAAVVAACSRLPAPLLSLQHAPPTFPPCCLGVLAALKVTNVREASQWMSYTYLYTRMTQVGVWAGRNYATQVLHELNPAKCCTRAWHMRLFGLGGAMTFHLGAMVPSSGCAIWSLKFYMQASAAVVAQALAVLSS